MIEWGDKLLSLAGVPPEKFNECLHWAFGEIDVNETMDDIRRKWNGRHGDIFIVGPNDSVKGFIWGIGKAYMERNFTSKIVVPQRYVGFN